MNQNWQTDERLNQISWDKRTFLMNWMKEQQANSNGPEQMLASVLALNQTLNNKNMTFTKEEQSILSEILFDALSPAERQRYILIRQMLGA